MSFIIVYLPTSEQIPHTKSYTTQKAAERFLQKHTFRYLFAGKDTDIYVSTYSNLFSSDGFRKLVPKHLLEVIEINNVI